MLIAFALVCFTWNPTRYNYIAWARAQWENMTPVVVFVGIALLAGWFFFLRTASRSLGTVGLVVLLALAGTILWGLFYYDLLHRQTTITWIVLALVSTVLALGMSWGHLRAAWSGQATVDEIDR
jgi:drug/metabolite transporter (DMT)-like permease